MLSSNVWFDYFFGYKVQKLLIILTLFSTSLCLFEENKCENLAISVVFVATVRQASYG